MGNSRRNPDRADPLRSLSRPLAGGSLQVLQQHLRGLAQSKVGAAEGGRSRSGSEAGDELDLTQRCEYCSAELPPGSTARRKYCGSTCSEAHRSQLDREARHAARESWICDHCGKTLPERKYSHAQYCNRSCIAGAQRARNMAAAEAMACEQCGAMFKPDRPKRRYCCHQCSVSARKLRAITCVQCGDTFRPRASTTRFCSISCVTKHKHASGVLRPFRKKLTVARLDRMLGG